MGTANFQGTVAYVSDTCTKWPAAVFSGSFSYSGNSTPVIGSPGGFTLTLATYTVPSLGISRSVTFSGTLTGALITGTVTLNETQDTSVVGGTAHYSAVAIFPITLQ